MVRPPCRMKMGLKKGSWTTEEDQILISYIQKHGHCNWQAVPKEAGLLRCGKSCRLRWMNYLRPDIKRGNFTREEEETILKLHEMLGNSWSAIASKLPGRTDNEIKNLWLCHLRKKAKLNKNSPEIHVQKVDKLKILSESLINSTSKAEKCILDHRSQKEEVLNFHMAKTSEVSQIDKMVRAPCRKKMGLKKGPWTTEEDQILISYIKKYGHRNWQAVPKEAGLLRCGKSCRLRWMNYLRPDIKRGNFTREEEETILKLHEMLGNSWSAIASRLPGRTDNEIKNLWLCHLRKKAKPNKNSPEIHVQKVDKLKILSEPLINSTSKAEERILDHRSQKEEVLNFRMAKTSEVSQIEEELAAEIGVLEKQRDDLEAELNKVNTSLAAALARLRNAREEREQYDEASDPIVAHLATKEDELSRSITSSRAEADVVNTWINFLEDTWVFFQTSYVEQKEKQVNDKLERYGDDLVNLAIDLLSAYKEELGHSITHFRKLVENLNSSEGLEIASLEMAHSTDAEHLTAIHPRKNLDEQYLDSEAKFITTFSVVESMRRQFHAQNEDSYRKDNQRVRELFDALDKIKDEFESIKRLTLEIEIPTRRAQTPFKEMPPKSPSSIPKQTVETPESKQDELSESPSIKEEKVDTDSELAKLESELGKVTFNLISLQNL